MNQYLVFKKEIEIVGVDICIVKAENPESAKRVFLENVIRKDETIQEDLRGKIINYSFVERFFIQDGKHIVISLDLPEEEVIKIFTHNVNKFFVDRPDYASKYLSEFDNDSELMDLPDDMMLFMLLNDPKYLEDIVVVDVQEITIN